MDDRPETFRVRGKVTGRDGDLLRGARIVVWWQNIRDRKELAAGVASEDGFYQLRYAVPPRAQKPALLLVEARSEHLDAPLFSALTPAGPDLEIDLNYEPPDQSQWADLVRSMEPLLEGLRLSSLLENDKHHDISFLATELGQTPEAVMRVAFSARLDAAFDVPAAAFYAFLRQQVPASLPSSLLDASQDFTQIDALVQSVGALIFNLTEQVQTQTLSTAVTQGLIGPQFAARITKLVGQLQALHTAALLSQPYAGSTATLAQVLGVTTLTSAKQQAFAQALAANTQPMSDFFGTLADGQHGLTDADVESIQQTMALSAFVENSIPLLQSLTNAFSSGQYTTLTDLARLSEQDWTTLVDRAGGAPTTDATGENALASFAKAVYERVITTYPTAALAGRIAGSTFVPVAEQKPLVQFFQANPTLELVTDNVAAFVGEQGNAAFTGIDGGDQAAVVANLRTFQRVLRVAPDPDVAQILLTNGLTSATQIAGLGRRQFVLSATAAGLTETQATAAFDAAEERYGGVVALYTRLNHQFLGIWPKAMGPFTTFNATVSDAVNRDPTLATLFGSQDYCASDFCTSVLSPAAYLCDLLLWLRNHPQNSGTALDVLDGRRPDIRHLLLNCPNTDTELPYIDLVNELLADAISIPPSVETKLASAITEAQGTIDVDSDAGFPSPNFYVTIGSETLLVTAVGGTGDKTWSVLRAQQGSFAASAASGAAVTLTDSINPRWKQTSEDATAEQLSAAPEYFNHAAYVKLYGASYPQSLPYSTGLDGLRTYLKQWNLPLWQLRQALLPLAGASAAQQAAVAAERFGIPPHGENLMTVANFVTLEVAWNTKTPLTDLVAVPAFLQAANITYESLLELLLVSWVQNGANVEIHGVDDTCMLSKQELKTLNNAWLDRAHRFLRLWLATGYKVWELDLLLKAPAVGNGQLDQATLVALLAFRQLQDATRLRVDQLLAFYQNIDRNTHRDPDGSTTTSLFDQIFLNATVTWAAPDPDLAAVGTGGTITDDVLSDHVKALQPALNVSGADLTTLVALTDGKLTLKNLSLIYRVNAMALASKFSISDLITIATLLTPGAADALAALEPLLVSPAATITFLKEAATIQQSRFTVDALTYLLTPPVGTTLAAPIGSSETTITVAGAAHFPAPGFYVSIGPEIIFVTAVSGDGDATWTVQRGQQGTPALAAPFGSPVDLQGGWATTTQMTPADVTATLQAVQQAEARLLAASTTLAAPIGAADTTITVTSDVNFPAANFYVYIGAEILLVTAVSGALNTTWTVVRGQQGTPAAGAPMGASVTPTGADLDDTVIATIAANAHTQNAGSLANDVTAIILETLQLSGTDKTLLTVLEDPALVGPVTPYATITIGGSPVAGDTLQTVLADNLGDTVTVSYPLTAIDAGDVGQTAADFAKAINASLAVTGPAAFLAPCTVAGSNITLTTLTPGAPGSNVTSANVASPGGLGHVSIAPATTTMSTLPPMTQLAFPRQFEALQLFDKVAVLVRGLSLVATDLTWLLTNAKLYGGLEFTALPVTMAQPALSLSPLLTTFLVVKLARLWTAAPPASSVQTLYDVISGVNGAAVANVRQTQSALQTITGWPLSDIEAFAAALDLVFPTMYLEPATYDALRTLEAMTTAVTANGAGMAVPSTTLVAGISASATSLTVASDIGFPSPPFYIYIGAEILKVTAVSGGDDTVWTVVRGQDGTVGETAAIGAIVTQTLAAQLVSWAAVPTSEVHAENLAAGALGELKAQQPHEAAWLSLAPTLMNPIRENRSAALQAYLIAQRDAVGGFIYVDDSGAPSANGLFNYFLIDVQMTSCQVTSRVVQAYIAIQIFVERCRMSLEAPAVVVDLAKDDTWNQWEWMSRYRVWQADREVFLYPENWLVESARPNRTELYQTFEQQVRQGPSTADYLETIVLNYIDGLDGVAHLSVTGTCKDPATGDIYVVARSISDPSVFYLRSRSSGAWSGWTQIPLNIKAHHAVPAMYRGRICVFWLQISVNNEPNQPLPAAEQSSSPPSQETAKYVTLDLYFSIFRNGSWAPAQTANGSFFDIPWLTSQEVSDVTSVEALYTLKVEAPTPAPGDGANLLIDVFRYGAYKVLDNTALSAVELAVGIISSPTVFSLAYDLTETAVQIGRAVFDARFSDLELRNLETLYNGPGPSTMLNLLSHAQKTYGPDAQSLLPLNDSHSDLVGELGLVPRAGALATGPADATKGAVQTLPLIFQFVPGLIPIEALLATVRIPFRVVGPATDVEFDPGSYFFFQDNRRCYWVESQKYYLNGTTWSTQKPKHSKTALYALHYDFHPFYHPFTRLFWDQLAGGDFGLLYDPTLQQVPDIIDTAGYPDVFSFKETYQPTEFVRWDHSHATTTLASPINKTQTTIHVTSNICHVTSTVSVPVSGFKVTIGAETLLVTDTSDSNNTTWKVKRGHNGTPASSAAAGETLKPTSAGEDRQFLDFSSKATLSVYNWELFYHVPLYIAKLLGQNQQFEDAQTWFHHIFNPVRDGNEPAPQRFWTSKPLHDLSSGQILAQQINDLLLSVNKKDQAAVDQVHAWEQDPFDPFLLADMRNGVPYMKSSVMSYLDNLIGWADNLFASESREALSEATLIYVIASELLGPTPVAVTPPEHADESFAQLEPKLDAFANAMVEVENSIGGSGGSGSGGKKSPPGPETFYFTIPSNPTLLGYWTKVADRLYKLRHCQNIAGAPLQLALFDAPIDPGLLIAARAAGVDLSSVLTDLGASLPNYRFTSLYSIASDFVNAVRAYGSSLQSALQQVDAGTLALLQQTTQMQLLADGSDVLDWQVQQAQSNFDSLQQTLALAVQKHAFNTTQPPLNEGELVVQDLSITLIASEAVIAAAYSIAGISDNLPDFVLGTAGFGGTPTAQAGAGGSKMSFAATCGAEALKSAAAALDNALKVAASQGSYSRRQDNWDEAAAEAQIQIDQANIQIAGAQLGLSIAQQNQTLHQEQIANIQKQIDFLNDKFTNDNLYDWMVDSLSTTYFQSYQLAYQLCKQVERCYRFELGIPDSSFIRFGYWDSLRKGLLAGETLNNDLRRLEASYLQQNARRYELSRYVSLELIDPVALQTLLVTGSCQFQLTEPLFDNDYPGHYNRRLTRVSVTVLYPNPGKYDNVKATLTLLSNKVRVKTDTGSGYEENPVGSDPRFVYNYAAVPQKIATGNAQDDPGLFVTSISSNITDQRYLPFENAGAVSLWQLDVPQLNNEIDLSTVGDVVVHLYYTALDGGGALQGAVVADNAANMPTSGIKAFSAQNDFIAPTTSGANPHPVAPWQGFLYPPTAGGNQVLTLQLFASKFPAWTRGKTITVTSLTVMVVAWPPAQFVIVPQAPLPTTPLTTAPVAGVSEPMVTSATIASPGIVPATWSFEIQQQGAADFMSLTPDTIGDVILLVSYDVS